MYVCITGTVSMNKSTFYEWISVESFDFSFTLVEIGFCRRKALVCHELFHRAESKNHKFDTQQIFYVGLCQPE